MKDILKIIKGVHPGKFVARELLKRGIIKRQFAISIEEHPQTLGAILKGTRRMNVPISLKIEEKLDLEEGFLMILQNYYDIKVFKKKNQRKPDISKLRNGTFWDTTIDKIDWEQMKVAVVKRVFSRGTEEEQEEITRFYGADTVEKIKLIKHQL
jgi:plasmid maintenance system antidote protein VapI